LKLLETFVEISAKDDALKAGLKSANRYARGQVREMQKVFNSLKIGMPDMRSIIAAAASFYGVKRAIESLVGSTVKAGSTFVDMSSRTGLAVETLSGLGYIAGQVGAEMGDVEKSVKFLTAAMLDVSRGTGEGKKTFDALGISVTDVRGNLRPATDVMMDAADKIAGMKNETQQAAFAMEMFGARTGAKMIPILKLGSAGMREYFAEAKRLGIVMSTDDANAADALGDSLATLTAAYEGAKRVIAMSVIPQLTAWVNSTTELIARNREMIGQKVGDWLKMIGGALETVWKHRDTIKTVFEIAMMTLIATKLYAVGNAVIFLTAALAGMATSAGLAALIAAAKPLLAISAIAATLYAAKAAVQSPTPITGRLFNRAGSGEEPYFPPGVNPQAALDANLLTVKVAGGAGGGGGGGGEKAKFDAKEFWAEEFRKSVRAQLAAETPEDMTESAREAVAEMDKIQKEHADTVLSLSRRVRDTSISMVNDRFEQERLSETARYQDEIAAYTGKADLLELAAQDHWMRMTAIAKDQSAAAAAESLQFATTWGDALYSMFEQSEWAFGKIGQAFAKMVQGMIARAAVIGALNFLSGGAGGFGGAFIGALLGRAAGGPVDAGTPYWVGERGPEVGERGKVIPNGAGWVFVPRSSGPEVFVPRSSGPEVFVPRSSGKVIPNGAGMVDNSQWQLNFYDTAGERAKMVGLDDAAFSRQFQRCERDGRIKIRKRA